MKRGLIRLTVLATSCVGALSVNAVNLAECTTIADDVARLACFDALSHSAESQPVTEAPDTQLVDTAIEAAEASDGNDSRFATQLKRAEANDGNRWSISPHKRNYILPVTYNSNINEEAWTNIFSRCPDGRHGSEVPDQLQGSAVAGHTGRGY